jgi:hypothetical protein
LGGSSKVYGLAFFLASILIALIKVVYHDTSIHLCHGRAAHYLPWREKHGQPVFLAGTGN